MDVGGSPVGDLDDVADGGAGGRGDDADALRHGGQGQLAAVVEQPLLEQAFLQLLEGDLQRADAFRIDRFGDQLVVAARFVDTQAPRAITCMPGSGVNGSCRTDERNITVRSWLLASLSVK